MSKPPPACPFDHAVMVRQPASEMMALLLPERNAVFKMVSGGSGGARGKWYECPKCSFVALFRKDASEP